MSLISLSTWGIFLLARLVGEDTFTIWVVGWWVGWLDQGLTIG